MRSDQELRRAIALVGATFTSEKVRRFVWRSHPFAYAQAQAAFQALCWVIGTDESSFGQTLEYVTRKLEQFSEQQEVNYHAQ